jgi:hypothetical protein
MTEGHDRVPALQPLCYDAACNRIAIDEVWVWSTKRQHNYAFGWFGVDDEDIVNDLIEEYRGDINNWVANGYFTSNEDDEIVAVELDLPTIDIRNTQKGDVMAGWTIHENALGGALEPTNSIIYHADHGGFDLLIRTTDDDKYEVRVDPLSIHALEVSGVVESKERAVQDASVLAAFYGD